jgi:beta-catenin-like protein 1
MVKETDIFPWLLKRIQIRESPLSQNKQYAAELLAILLQSARANRIRLTELDGVDLFLQLLSPYRKRDPVKGGDEEEFVENVFDCLTCVVDEVEGKQKFVQAEGVELALIMLREGKMSKPRALRLLDHAISSVQHADVAIRVVEAAGLKTLFGMFMKKVR